MNSSTKTPKIFLYSLILPIIWFTLGFLMNYFLPGKRLGSLGLLLIVYLTLTPIAWHLSKSFNRYFSRSEKIRLILYLTLWALFCEFWALWYYLSEEAGTPLEGGSLYIVVSITAIIDLLFMSLGVHFLGRKLFEYFSKGSEATNA